MNNPGLLFPSFAEVAQVPTRAIDDQHRVSTPGAVSGPLPLRRRDDKFFVVRCACGAAMTQGAWDEAVKRGIQHIPGFDGEPGYDLDIRDCPICKSSIGMVIK